MGIDLNTIDEDDAAAAEALESLPGMGSSSVCLELWHACAGPLVWLPRKGSAVVYLPQGHLELMGGDFGGGQHRFDLPPHVFCRVADVKLRAEAATDEVYAQLSLVAEAENVEKQLRNGEIEENGGEADDLSSGARSSTTPHMFCKTLTASDTSTHGGFSVPRRAAEDCFPPLDYKLPRPSQELIAKDLHGMEWRFRHIYRGQPRRHLLTTGWSAFVNKKKLVSGDAVLFLRGVDGVLRLGIRRAAQLKNNIAYSACIQNVNPGGFVAVANAVLTKSVFHIQYNPRASPSDFIVPYWKFSKIITHSFSIGTRFKMLFESEDAAERRYTGSITGIGDVDPVRWPGSKWRCLLVRWDDEADIHRQNRLSPWEIEPSGSFSGSSCISEPGSKRTKISISSTILDSPIPNESGVPGFGESARFHKVLQGQEILGFGTMYSGTDVCNSQLYEMRNHQFTEARRCIPNADSLLVDQGDRVRDALGKMDYINKCSGFGESIRFNKVLQGQEIFPLKPSSGGAQHDNSQAKENGGYGAFKSVHMSKACNSWALPMMGFNSLVQQPSSLPTSQVSSPSSVLMFQQATSQPPPCFRSFYGNDCSNAKEGGYVYSVDSLEVSGGKEAPLPCQPYYRPSKHVGGPLSDFPKENEKIGLAHSAVLGTQGHDSLSTSGSSYRLFGFSLVGTSSVANGSVGSQSSTPPLSPIDLENTSKIQVPHKAVGHNCSKVDNGNDVILCVQ